MKNCRKCGLPLGFRKLPSGKWCPTNPDGSDHFDICRLTQFQNASQDVCVGMVTEKTVPTVKLPKCADDFPPWDDSIISDWSWVRGWKVVKSKIAYRKYVNPAELLKLVNPEIYDQLTDEQREHMRSI